MPCVKCFLEIIRPLNSFIIGLAILLGGILVTPYPTSEILFPLLLACTSGIIISSAGNVINDYVDREIDKINAPHRPIPSGRMPPQTALMYFAILVIIGNIITVFVNLVVFITGLFASILLIVYSIRLKREGIFGNLCIAILASLTFFFGGSAVGKIIKIFFPSLFAFLITLGREILKGVEDYYGDSTFNIKTLAVLFGTRKASIVAISIFAFIVIISPIPVILGFFGLPCLLLGLIVDCFLIISSLKLISGDQRKINLARRLSKYAMLIGILAFFLDTIFNWWFYAT